MTFVIENIKNNDLRYAFDVIVSGSYIVDKFDDAAKNIASSINLNGFRPGKVPLHIIKKKHFAKIKDDVLGLVCNQALHQFFKDNNLTKASSPLITVPEFDEKDGVKINVAIEVLPSYKLGDLSKLPFEFIEIDLIDEDKEDLINFFFEKYKVFEEKPKGAASEVGDKMEISLSMTCEGQDVAHYNDRYVFVIGQNDNDELSFLNPQKNLVELKINDTKEITITMPDNNYLSGKEAVCKVVINNLWQEAKKEKNDAFAQHIGYKTYEEMQNQIVEHSRKYFGEQVYTWNKRSLLDQLDKYFNFSLPITLVQKEFNYIWNLLGGNFDAGEKQKIVALYKNLSKRRVKLKIVLDDVVKTHNLSVSEGDLAQRIMWLCKGDIDLFKKVAKENRALVQREHDALLEDQMLFLLQKQVSNKVSKVNFRVAQEKADSLTLKEMEGLFDSSKGTDQEECQIREGCEPLSHLHKILTKESNSKNRKTIEVE